MKSIGGGGGGGHWRIHFLLSKVGTTDFLVEKVIYDDYMLQLHIAIVIMA